MWDDRWRGRRPCLSIFLPAASTSRSSTFGLEASDLGEPILLIHGFASNHRVNWVKPRWVETLDPRRAPGRRASTTAAMGQSEKLYAPADYRADLMAQDAANLLAHLGIERADVMGYSMGARIASLLALGRAEARARADPRRARRPARARRRPAGGDRRGDGGAVARRPRRSDAAHVPRLRRADEERPRRARRLHPRLAPEPHAGRSRRGSPRRRWSRSGRRDTVAGDAHKLAAMMPQAEALDIPGRDHNLAVGDRAYKARGARLSRTPGVSPLRFRASTKVLITKQVTSLHGNVNTASDGRLDRPDDAGERKAHGAGRGESRTRGCRRGPACLGPARRSTG